MNLWTPNSHEWQGQDAHLIGGGPSLKGFDFSRLKGRNVIGCNDAMHLGAEIVSYVIFGDSGWWQRNRFELERYRGKVVSVAPSLLEYNLPNIFKMRRERDGVHMGSTLGWNYSTGAAAINLAISLGATRIFLLGYDLGKQARTTHWHIYNQKDIVESVFERFLRGFACVRQHLPPGVEVINVTDGSSRLLCFPRISFEEYRRNLISEQEVAA